MIKPLYSNPPFSLNVSTDIGRNFFNILEKNFPKDHRLNKIINKNTVKLSYSCMPNMGRILKNHNKSVIAKADNTNEVHQCNCRSKPDCPLQGNCLAKSNVYKADVETNRGDIYPYIGISDGIFKSRWNDHNLSFRDIKYRNKTELSNLIWDLKDKNIHFKIKWKILKHCQSYRAGSKNCNLCLNEKLLILKNPKCINKRTEILSKCRHRRKFLIKFCT